MSIYEDTSKWDLFYAMYDYIYAVKTKPGFAKEELKPQTRAIIEEIEKLSWRDIGTISVRCDLRPIFECYSCGERNYVTNEHHAGKRP